MGLRLNGATSGHVELNAPAVAGTTTLELPTDSIKPGMVLLATQSFTAANTVSFDNCFSSAYDNYRMVASLTGTTGVGVAFRMRSAGVDNTAASYNRQYLQATNGTVSGVATTGMTNGEFMTARSGLVGVAAADFFSPFLAATTSCVSTILDPVPTISVATFTANHTVASSFDGITVYVASGTITGSIQIYGYRKAL